MNFSSYVFPLSHHFLECLVHCYLHLKHSGFLVFSQVNTGQSLGGKSERSGCFLLSSTFIAYLLHERVHKRFPFHPFPLTSFHMSVFSSRQFNIQSRNGETSPSPNISNTCLVNINSCFMMAFVRTLKK